MAGPWEKYAAASVADGPWAKYAQPEQAPEKERGIVDNVTTALRLATPAGLATALVSPEGRRDLVNAAAGGVRGAGSIGSTLVAPVDIASDAMQGRGLSLQSNRDRRNAITQVLSDAGADPKSFAFGAGKIATEVGGSAGAGGAVANALRAVGAPALATAVGSGGMAGGGSMLTRAAGGAINGGVTTGLVDPSQAGAGALIGGAAPGVIQVAGRVGQAVGSGLNALAEKLMQSAIKPTLAQRMSGDSDTAIKTLLEYGISPTKAGVNKLKALIDDLNNQISTSIAGSTATVNKNNVLEKLDDVRGTFTNQVSPSKDLNAIQGVADDFAAHPAFPGETIPVQQAQSMKQGTYRVLAKKYGEVGSAETEAQKGLARGLKEEIATAVPGVGALNAEESKLLTTLSVAERRALLQSNNNPMGLSLLAKNPAAWAAFMADRSSAFKALAARMASASVPAANDSGNLLLKAAGNPLLRAAGTEAISANP